SPRPSSERSGRPFLPKPGAPPGPPRDCSRFGRRRGALAPLADTRPPPPERPPGPFPLLLPLAALRRDLEMRLEPMPPMRFIIFDISLNWETRAWTWAGSVPDPLAIRTRRDWS